MFVIILAEKVTPRTVLHCIITELKFWIALRVSTFNKLLTTDGAMQEN